MGANNNYKMRHIESRTQIACVKWFDYAYPQYSTLLFCVPNGGARNPREASIMKAEGIRRGVADLILLVARDGYGALCLETKTETGKQSPEQKEWQKQAEKAGNKYVIFRSVDEFIDIVTDYLSTI